MNDFLSGYNFARQSDVIFSETILENNTHKTYIVDEFELDNNNIIFCKTDNIISLFEILQDEEELNNLKLITHESDYEINEKIFHLKPKCISKWYAVNVNYQHDDLIPIPLGLANDYCSITLKFNNLIKKGNPNKLLYVNHRISTNSEQRKWIYDYFKNNDWCTVDEPNLSLSEYKTQLDDHEFILCPRGNGIDTHRLWESFYHGIIPVVENHIHYSCLENLPVIVVDSFKEINEKFLLDQKEKILKKELNMDKLKVSWWINLIKNS